MLIWKSSFSKTDGFGPIFPWKILCIGWNHIFQVEIWRNFARKKTMLKTYYRMRGVITNISLQIKWQLPIIITLCYLINGVYSQVEVMKSIIYCKVAIFGWQTFKSLLLALLPSDIEDHQPSNRGSYFISIVVCVGICLDDYIFN